MDGLIFHNDRVRPLEEARLSPGQAGLLTGWGVFTTLRLYHGEPFASERHWLRLSRDAARMRMTLEYQEDFVRRAIIELARANRRAEGMARVSFVRNTGGLWSDAKGPPAVDLLVFTRELPPWPAAHRLMLQPMGILSGGEYAGAKMLSWVPHIAMLERARAEGFDDALLLNEKAQLAECTSANIFLARQGKVLTPPLGSGCLPGVTREVLLEIASGAGIELREQDLTAEDLSTAEEAFVSSTTREVAAVGFISPKWTYSGPGKITQALEEAFCRFVQSYVRVQKV